MRLRWLKECQVLVYFYTIPTVLGIGIKSWPDQQVFVSKYLLASLQLCNLLLLFGLFLLSKELIRPHVPFVPLFSKSVLSFAPMVALIALWVFFFGDEQPPQQFSNVKWWIVLLALVQSSLCGVACAVLGWVALWYEFKFIKSPMQEIKKEVRMLNKYQKLSKPKWSSLKEFHQFIMSLPIPEGGFVSDRYGFLYRPEFSFTTDIMAIFMAVYTKRKVSIPDQLCVCCEGKSPTNLLMICGHAYHRDCLYKWMLQPKPVCADTSCKTFGSIHTNKTIRSEFVKWTAAQLRVKQSMKKEL